MLSALPELLSWKTSHALMVRQRIQLNCVAVLKASLAMPQMSPLAASLVNYFSLCATSQEICMSLYLIMYLFTHGAPYFFSYSRPNLCFNRGRLHLQEQHIQTRWCLLRPVCLPLHLQQQHWDWVWGECVFSLVCNPLGMRSSSEDNKVIWHSYTTCLWFTENN